MIKDLPFHVQRIGKPCSRVRDNDGAIRSDKIWGNANVVSVASVARGEEREYERCH